MHLIVNASLELSECRLLVRFSASFSPVGDCNLSNVKQAKA